MVTTTEGKFITCPQACWKAQYPCKLSSLADQQNFGPKHAGQVLEDVAPEPHIDSDAEGNEKQTASCLDREAGPACSLGCWMVCNTCLQREVVARRNVLAMQPQGCNACRCLT